MLLLVTACQSTKIPNIRFYQEIPFIDCSEAVFVESLTHQVGSIRCEEWKKIKPFLISIDPTGKKEIFKQWSEACRWAQDKSACNVQLDSVKDAVDAMDKVAETILGPIGAKP